MNIGLDDPSWRPSYGSLRHEFAFDPLHYGVGGAAQRAFKEQMRNDLKRYGFMFVGEIAVTWRLFVDEQSRWESDTGADVDNFAKLLNDGLCGKDGLIIDDVQIQSLQILWLPTAGPARFDLQIDCMADEWLDRRLALYEMSDGLYYPILRLDAWPSSAVASTFIHYLDHLVLQPKRLRHQLRRLGLTRPQAYEEAVQFAPMARGFHPTRAAASGIDRLRRPVWAQNLPAPDDETPRPVDAEALAQYIADTRRMT